jgi:precorrin-6B methylase 2
MSLVGDAPAIPDTPLALAAGLRTRIDAAGHVLIETPLGGIVDAGPYGLSILALFSRPRTVADAFATLESRAEPHPELMPAKATIVQLVDAGAVVEQQDRGVRFGWADPGEHARMLSDVHRTDAYVAAIRAAVRPDDVVLDIGTGSGVLAVAAAQAGARHVYAIEASDIAAVAQQVFEANDIADRVTLLEGWSTQVDLPEAATLLVTETLGIEPLEEDILRTILDARQRLLAPGARLIPNTLRLHAQALAVPDVHRWASRVDRAAVDGWRERYGVDLGPLREAQRRVPLHWPVDSQVVATWRTLGPSAQLVQVDLDSFASPGLRAGTRLDMDTAGIVDAILVTVSADLHDDIRLVQRPRRGEISSWDSSVWFLPDGIDVVEGAGLKIGYRFGIVGEADGLTCERSSTGRD